MPLPHRDHAADRISQGAPRITVSVGPERGGLPELGLEPCEESAGEIVKVTEMDVEGGASQRCGGHELADGQLGQRVFPQQQDR